MSFTGIKYPPAAPALLLLLASFTHSAVVQCQQPHKPQLSTYDFMSEDSAGRVTERIRTYEDDREYKFVVADGRVSDLYVDEIKIAAEKYAEYDPVIGLIRSKLQKDHLQAARDLEKSKQDQEQAIKDQAQALKDQQQAVKDQLQAIKDQEQASKDRVQAIKDQAQAGRDRVQAEYDRKQAAEYREMTDSLLEDLVRERIVQDIKNIGSVTLSADGMTVNGKLMPEAVCVRYKEKYALFAAGNFTYGSSQHDYKSIHINKRQ